MREVDVLRITDSLQVDDVVIDTLRNNVEGVVIKMTKSTVHVQFKGYKGKFNYSYANAYLNFKPKNI